MNIRSSICILLLMSMSFGSKMQAQGMPIQVRTFIENRDGFGSLAEYRKAEIAVFTSLTTGDWKSFLNSSDRWIRMRSKWELTKRGFVNEESNVAREKRIENFLGFVEASVLCSPPKKWEDFFRRATLRSENGGVDFRAPPKPIENNEFPFANFKILVEPPNDSTNGIIKLLENGKTEERWQATLWHTNDMLVIGLPNRHYFIGCEPDGEEELIYIFGIASNYAFVTTLKTDDGSSSGFVYLDCSGVLN